MTRQKNDRQRTYVLPAFVFAAALGCFLPALGNDFVDWDDRRTIVENPHIRGFTTENVAWMFTTFHMGHYQPLAWISLAADHSLWGVSATGFLLMTALIHALNAVLFYFLIVAILTRLAGPDRRIWLASAAGALLFAVHPLRVESVAWATERRDVLAAFFLLGTILFHLKWIDTGRRRWYAAALAAFVLSLASKAWGMTFPVVLLLLDAYPYRRLTRRAVLEKVPYFLFAVAAVPVAMLAQKSAGAAWDWSAHPLDARVGQAAYGLCFYTWKSIAPIGLAPLYQLEPGRSLFSPVYLVSLLVVGASAALLWIDRRRRPGLAVAFAVFAVIVSPVLGFAQSGPQEVADRYTYLACLPFAILIAGALLRIRNPRIALVGAASAIATLALLTISQIAVWKNPMTLWHRAVQVEPRGHVARANFAAALDRAGLREEAVRQYRVTLHLRPRDLKTRHNLALALAKQGDFTEARREWKTVIRRTGEEDRSALAWYCLGVTAERLGEPEEAARCFALSGDRKHLDRTNSLLKGKD